MIQTSARRLPRQSGRRWGGWLAAVTTLLLLSPVLADSVAFANETAPSVVEVESSEADSAAEEDAGHDPERADGEPQVAEETVSPGVDIAEEESTAATETESGEDEESVATTHSLERSASTSCTPSNIYGITDDGSIYSAPEAGGSATRMSGWSDLYARWDLRAEGLTQGSNRPTKDGVNGLAIAADGTMYAFARYYQFDPSYPDTTWNVSIKMMVKDPASSARWRWLDEKPTKPTTYPYSYNTGARPVAGAIDPESGKYVWGGFKEGFFQIHEIDLATGKRNVAGRIDAKNGATHRLNGDIAFDAAGNLYVVSHNSDTQRITIATVTKADLDAGRRENSNYPGYDAWPSLIPSSVVKGKETAKYDGEVNGIAIGSNGGLYIGTTKRVYRVNPLTAKVIGSQITSNPHSTDSTDLASCAENEPTTLTVEKDLRDASSNHAFKLSVGFGGAEITSATAKTRVQGTTVLREKTGPTMVTPGDTFALAETGSALNQYTSQLSCRIDGIGGQPGHVPVSGSATTSGSLVIPSQAAGKNITCTFTNTPKSQAVDEVCSPGDIYGVSNNGQSLLIRADGTYVVDNGWRTLYDTWQLPPHLSNGGNQGIKYGVNGVAVASDGTQYAYASAYSYDSNYPSTLWWPMVSILTKKPGEGWKWWDHAATPHGASYYSLSNGEVPVTGAVDPSTGNYLVGGFEKEPTNGQARFVLREINLTTGKSGVVGRVNVGAWSDTHTTLNGDIAFDDAGNLFILSHRTGATVGSGPLTITTVLKSALDAARAQPGGTIPGNVTRAQQGTYDGNVVGIAVEPDGMLVLSSTKSVWRVDPNTVAQVGPKLLSSNPFAGGSSITDLASCSSPNTMIVQKNVVDRVRAGDQFGLELQGHNGDRIASATTSGTKPGVQSQQVGPTIVTAGSTYRIKESGRNGATLSDYTSTWECTDAQDAVLASGSGTAGTVTIPSSYRSSPVTCTFTNAPILPEIELVKVDADDDTVKLAGAKFQLWKDVNANGTLETNIDTKVGTQQTTPASGIITWSTGLAAGTYLLEETAAPAGYEVGPTSVYAITLTSGKETITVENALRGGSATWTKVDSEGRALGGSEWNLVGPVGPNSTVVPVTDCVATSASGCAHAVDKDPRQGFFSVTELAAGGYKLIETKAPAGFQLDTTPKEFTVGAPGSGDDVTLDWNLGEIVNTQQPPLTIPLTGGIGTFWFLIIGGGFIGIFLVTALQRIRLRVGEAS